ncbi:MAG TPA: quinolinate synthase NadA [Candidatus Cloacimonadota bacterium]|nr:quinolinate synthase NadA [Candidatus Cloacimonadota bacterium]
MNQIIEDINRLRKEKNAIILAHNYQALEIQEIADHRGDSLQLSVLAKSLKAEIIVFCGVRFMAETAAMLNPEARVLLPRADAGCPMADMITADQLREFKAKYPGAVVVCYVNSTAEVKAESDVCCTSSNAVKIIKAIPRDKEILFVPDQNLGSWAARQAGREVITWNGYCPVHHWQFTAEKVRQMRKSHPGYTLLAHPECPAEVTDLADLVMSTSGMMDYAEKHDKLIIATETAMIRYLNHKYPEKDILPLAATAICQNMLKTSLHDLHNSLLNEVHHITVPQETAMRAIGCLDKMLELSR